jgi:hypothetical protein
MFKKIGVFVLFAFVAGVPALEPDYIRTTVYNVDGNGNNLVSTVYSGLGREVQSKFKIENGKDRVVATFYDNLNRKRVVTKPFIDTVFEGSYLPGGFDSINNFLKETYKRFDTLAGDPFAYSEIQYYQDQSGRVKVTGAPGVNNRIGSGNENRSWFFSVSLDTLSISLHPGTITFQNGLIKNLSVNSGFDTVALLDSLYGYLLDDSSGFSSCSHFLTIVMEPSGSYSQKLDDELGRTIASWSDPDSTMNNEILARTRYDFYGNPLEEIAPVNLMDPLDTVLISNSKYLYNTLGQVIRRETPDGIIDTILYKSNGQISSISSWTFAPDSTKLQYEITYYAYDSFGRQTIVWKIRERELVARISNYYDNTDQLETLKDYYNIPSGILDNLKNINNRLVGTVANNYLGSKVYMVIDLFSYNDEGEVSKKFKIVPGLPLQEINYNYDIHGKIINQTIICGRDTVIKQYSYDTYGRIRKITHHNNGGKELVGYTYDSMGKTTVKTLDSIHDIQYLYTIQDQIKKIQSSGPSGFSEDITYLPNGNIDTLKSYYNGGVTDSIFNTYSYDNVNRLIAVSSNKSEYNSSYNYDQAGRFKKKEEGSNILSDYTYHHKTNRLRFAKDTIKDYVYDQRGNLIVDRFKNMVILYNGDNLPTQFRFYKSIPATVTTDARGTVVISDSTFSGNIYQYMDHVSNTNINYSLISTVTMLYDASGNRVLKMENIQ